MDMKRFFLYAIVIAALALAGCGGNGGGGMDVATPMPDPTPPPPPATCPEGQTGTPPDCMDPAPTELTEHQMAFVRGIVNPSVADDPSTSRRTDHVSRPGQSAGERLNVTPGGMAATELAAATNQYVPPSHMPRTYIGPAPEQTATGFGPTTGVNINAPNSPFKKMGSEDTLGSFMTQTYVRETRGVTDTVTLFSNIDAPKSVAYNTYYPTTGSTRVGVAAAARNAETGALTIAAAVVGTNALSSYAAGLFESDRRALSTDTDPRGFPRSGTATYSALEGDEHQPFDGTFNGIDGKFVCVAATSCTAQANDNGVLIGISEGWEFRPTGNPTMLMVPNVNYDSDYLSFGYWISETTTASASRFEVGTVYDGSQPTNVLAVLTGTATYTGEAAGAYVRKGDTPAVGEFTGQASLTANFGDGTTDIGTIKGTISRLVDGSETIDPNWTVDLEMATIEAADTGATFNGRTTGAGNWRGGFFGTPAAASAVESERYPHGVAGDFTGHFENGHVIGAFGATRR